jgi:hypothetical protein
MLALTQLAGFGRRQATVAATIDSDKVNFELAAWLQGQGLWNGVSAFNGVVTIAPSVLITASSPAAAAFRTGSFPGGTTITLLNNGLIQGAGGAGGNGGSTVSANGTGGQGGGHALSLQVALTIDNTNGFIWGGGGGGGGGAGTGLIDDGTEHHAPIAGGAGGGAGGGGAGRVAGLHGSAGVGAVSVGGTGANGSAGAGGAGGGGGVGFNNNNPGGGGGAGGAPGASGSSGGGTASGAGGGGGGGGWAIVLNGNPVPTFLGGNTPDRVRGAVL